MATTCVSSKNSSAPDASTKVLEVMRWKKGENIEGEYPIKNDDVVRIEEVIGEKLPVGLEYFIGVYA
ncbi:pyocin S6 family toxin immunity protein [Pseudomonas aeruginosa]|uniref:pyocin S6 family toxin immunity protein n=1 Tax=Pseudomonas aeruginosa TaxID=287 RepID=UPI003D18C7EF